MNRVVWFIICTVVGLELIAWGLLIPVHLHAIDARVLELSSSKNGTLTDEGLSMVRQDNTGPAQLILAESDELDIAGRDKLSQALGKAEEARPMLKTWGGAALYLDRVFAGAPPPAFRPGAPILDLLLIPQARASLTNALRQTPKPGVLEVLQTRAMTNTVLFPAANSASGQPLEATIALTALLVQQDQIGSPLRNSLDSLVFNANRTGGSEGLEQIYMDLLGLGKRLNWGQFVDVLRQIPDTNTLAATAELFREQSTSLPLVFSAIHLADSARPVVHYLQGYPETGMKDLAFALHSGTAATRELLERQAPIHNPWLRDKVVAISWIGKIYQPMAELALDHPALAALVKYGVFVLGALLLARALSYLSPSLTDEIVRNRPFVTGPQVVMALCLLFLVLFFTETLVTRATPARMPIHVKFPVASAALRATIPHQVTTMIDKFSEISLLVFFVLQGCIYVFCRMKLAEIRRQTMPSRLKLRLLENEENLFDAGLYFGFVGTVLALIMFSVGIHQFSLMAAYSSTSFGIIFVSILKIFHVRPYRRRLILDAEMTERTAQPA